MRAETNNDLEEQVAQDNERFAEMENSQEEMQSHFEAQAKESERLRGEVRSKNRDLDTLRVWNYSCFGSQANSFTGRVVFSTDSLRRLIHTFD